MTAVAMPSADLAGPLTRAETIALGDCEQRIERGLKTFLEVGSALAAIRDNRLYRATHESFEAYSRERWNLSRPRAYELMTAAEVVSAMADTEQPPTNERQARELAKVPEPDRADVWAEAVERTDGKPTAAAVRQVVAERAEPVAPTGPTCEACHGEIDPDGLAAGYRRCEDCDSDGEHVGREPGGPCTGCNPEPELVAGQDYRTDPAERIAAVAEVAPEFVRPADPEPVTPPPGSPATWTPEQHAANDREIERRRTIEAAERAAKSLVFEIRGMVTVILSGLACDAPGILVGLADIDECRAALDRLEAGVMA